MDFLVRVVVSVLILVERGGNGSGAGSGSIDDDEMANGMTRNRKGKENQDLPGGERCQCSCDDRKFVLAGDVYGVSLKLSWGMRLKGRRKSRRWWL